MKLDLNLGDESYGRKGGIKISESRNYQAKQFNAIEFGLP